MDIQIGQVSSNSLNPTITLPDIPDPNLDYPNDDDQLVFDNNEQAVAPMMYQTMPTELLHQTSQTAENRIATPPYEHGTDASPDAGDRSPGSQKASTGRPLSTSKRAEQNRRAQRAFRERRDAHMKHLAERASMLEEAVANANEANRRWEETRAVVDQLRHENAMLRAALENLKGNSNVPSSLEPAALSTNGSSDPTTAGRTSHPSLQGQNVQFVVATSTDDSDKKRKRVVDMDDLQNADSAITKRRELVQSSDDDS